MVNELGLVGAAVRGRVTGAGRSGRGGAVRLAFAAAGE